MSNINPSLIDATYPIAGQDNDSQGFRTNYANIVTNFTYAENEITDLQNKVILKSALTEVGTLNNNFAGALMSNALIQGFGEVILDNGVVSGSLAINYANGSFQRVTPSASLSLAFNSWPAAGNLGKLRLEVVVTNVAYTLTLPSSVSLGTSGILGLSGNVITFPATGNYLYEFSSFDGGNSFFILDLVNNRTTSSGSFNAIAASSINANVTAIGSQASAVSGTLLRMTNLDTVPTRMMIDSYVNAGNPTAGLTVRGGRGTAASPLPVQTADMFGSIAGHGYGASQYTTASTGLIGFIAEGNFTNSSNPTAISFQVTPVNQITKAEQMRLTSGGVLEILSNVSPTTSSYLAGSVVVTGAVGVSGNLNVNGTITGGLSASGNLVSGSNVAFTGGSITGTAVGCTTFANAIAQTTTTYAVGTNAIGTVFANVSGGTFTVTLPAANASGNLGRIIRVAKADTSATVVTVASAGGNVAGTATITIGLNSSSQPIGYSFQSDGTNWWIVG